MGSVALLPPRPLLTSGVMVKMVMDTKIYFSWEEEIFCQVEFYISFSVLLKFEFECQACADF